MLNLLARIVRCEVGQRLWFLLTLEDSRKVGLLAHPHLSRLGHGVELQLRRPRSLAAVPMLQQVRVILRSLITLRLLTNELLDHCIRAPSGLPLTRQESSAFCVLVIGRWENRL